MIDKLLEEPDSEDESDSDSSLDDNRSISMSISSISLDSSWNSLMSGITATTSHSLGVSSQFLSDRPEMATPAFAEFIDAVRALHDEAQKSRVLDTRPKLIRALQLHLLPEWEMYAPEKFRQKLHVPPVVFERLVACLKPHPIFYNNSHNPQLPIAIQLVIFLNGVGHYGNAATMEDLAEWAGVSIGTVYNCFKQVMIAILRHHDNKIHFDPLDHKDQEEWKRSQQWVEGKMCREWRRGFLCVDSTPFNLFQKPGWHGEGFFDKIQTTHLQLRYVDLSFRWTGSSGLLIF